jgi:hypothetical protein
MLMCKCFPVSWKALVSKGPTKNIPRLLHHGLSTVHLMAIQNCTVLDLGTLAISQFSHWIISFWIVDTIRGPLRKLCIFYFGFCAGRVGSSVMHVLVEEARWDHYILEGAWEQAESTITCQWWVNKIKKVVSCISQVVQFGFQVKFPCPRR